MTHVYSLEVAQLDRPALVTIGVFDGVHLGHQELLRHLVTTAHARDAKAVVLTFFPHPDAVLQQLHGRYYLTSPEERAAHMLRLGVDVVVTHPFNDNTRQQRALSFVEKLVHHLQMRELWVGEDFALGYQREGNVPFLRACGQEMGFTVQTLELVTYQQGVSVISSTAIRQCLQAGDVAMAHTWLGRAYQVQGRVVHGEKRGRLVGFPTANLAVWSEQLLPKIGVYAGWATINGTRYMAVTNIGVRPTFGGDDVRVEPHLLDFSGDIYDATVTLTFETRLRDEQKFAGVDALKAQLAQDVRAGRAFLETNPV